MYKDYLHKYRKTKIPLKEILYVNVLEWVISIKIVSKNEWILNPRALSKWLCWKITYRSLGKDTEDGRNKHSFYRQQCNEAVLLSTMEYLVYNSHTGIWLFLNCKLAASNGKGLRILAFGILLARVRYKCSPRDIAEHLRLAARRIAKSDFLLPWWHFL